MDFLLITDSDALAAYTGRARTATSLCVDTEFMRERTYWPQLALVQVCAEGECAVIDPLAFDAREGLRALLGAPEQIKVFHAAGQDMEVLHHTLGMAPAPVFDTQLAASLLGYGDQIGYGALVEKTLGEVLPKAFSRMDWMARPIDPDALDYAAADVIWLEGAYAKLCEELERLGRSGWLDEDLAAISRPERWVVKPDNAWRKLKGIRKLRPNQRHVAARVCAWRETTALARNLPRRWVLKDDVVLDIARRKPRQTSELQRIRGLEDKAIARDGEAILAAVAGDQSWPDLDTKDERPLPAEAEPVVDALMALLRQQALSHQMTASAIAGRAELTRLAAGDRDLDLLEGWRARVAGDALVAFLTGGQSLRIAPGTPPTLTTV
ncbi:ribonuclease D [Abyssibacter sp.]|jgi:ribonuclease D|uniref:ribonuclease D n=1 Tax=Abyssibacter sp. TaxID=2320200 RepID=UPI003518E3BE